MGIPVKVIKYLEKNKIKYLPFEHKVVYTSFDKAATLKLKPNMIGKTMVVKTDKETILALIPGNKNFDKNKFKKIINSLRKKAKQKLVSKIDFASEKWMKNNLKGVKLGAVPPFGGLWKMETYIDKSLLKLPKIIINSGDYKWSFKINPSQFKKIKPEPVFGSFSKAKK